MFYDSYREEDLEALFEESESLENYEEDEYRQDRYEEMTNRFGGH
jgi:hypothetical protein